LTFKKKGYNFATIFLILLSQIGFCVYTKKAVQGSIQDSCIMIVKKKNKFFVKSKKGKNLGGPYANKKMALKRLRQVEYFKSK